VKATFSEVIFRPNGLLAAADALKGIALAIIVPVMAIDVKIERNLPFFINFYPFCPTLLRGR
jgi:hypothetical protein